jgi:hypothetical protein
MQLIAQFEPWNQMLRQYVDVQGRVNYSAWQAEAASDLKDWLKQTFGLDRPNHLTANQQLATWINLYNALVIDQVLDQYPIDSIRPTVLGIPNWIAFLRFFQKPYRIGDQTYSLNRIEHGILRQQFSEPRIHFALVCAAVGCPLLRNEAYQPEYIQEQLEADAKRFINNSAKVNYQPPILYCSKIFKWYKSDFLKKSNSLPEYLQSYLTQPIDFKTVQIRYLDYDWQLNQRMSA